MKALRIASVAAAALVAAAGAWVLYHNEPTTAGFFPACLFRKLTGLDCPGCGMTRGLYHLLHGHVWTAFRFNPLMFVLLPLVLGGGTIALLRGEPPALTRKPWFGWTVLSLISVFWVVRNTPLWPF
ncbi:MAG TPA: DUF2752 domain-containing protein [Thermoanaerobaculia bacterium]